MNSFSKFVRLAKKFGLRKAIYRTLIYLSSKKEDTLYDYYKQKHFKGISGDVVEIGVGYGSNFPYYGTVNTLALIEPDVIERDDLLDKLERSYITHFSLIEKPFEEVTLASSSADAIVTTLVFCSVKNPSQFLHVIYQTLKPGGSLFFLEHIRAKSLFRRILQRMVNPFWRGISGGCQCDRRTDAQLFSDTRFTVMSHDYFQISSGFPWVRTHVVGVLKKL